MNGNTILLCRDNMVRACSCYNHMNHADELLSRRFLFSLMFLDESAWDGEDLKYQYWTERKMHFEDIKTKPMEKLTEICELMNIEWSDSMLRTRVAVNPINFWEA